MILTFVDKNVDVCKALSSAFGDHTIVYNNDILDYDADIVITPGNSFGIMNGGIDLVFQSQFEEKVRDIIKRCYDGEALVGQAFIVDGLIYAPTMRVPMKIAGTVNVYLAFRAALKIIKYLSNVGVACPGFGTLTGGMSPIVAAMQMWYAYREVILNEKVSMADHYNIVNGTL